MAESNKDDGEETTEAVEEPKKSSKKLFIIIGAVVLLLVGIGVPVLMMGKKVEVKETPELDSEAALHDGAQPEGAGEEEELAEGEEPLGSIYPLETFVVNLEGGKFIRIQVQLEFMGRDIPTKFYNRIVPMRDKMISLISSKSADDIGSSKSKDALKEEIKGIVNEVLKKEEIKKVYFSQFIIQ